MKTSKEMKTFYFVINVTNKLGLILMMMMIIIIRWIMMNNNLVFQFHMSKSNKKFLKHSLQPKP